MAFVKVGTKADIVRGEVREFEVNGVSIVVANVDDIHFYAVDNLCTHDDGPLGEGTIVDSTVECPRHGARFDLATGRVKALPAVRPIKTYAVKVEGEEVSVDVG